MSSTNHILKGFILAVTVLCVAAGEVYAQNYYHSPNDTLVAYTEPGNSVTMNITQLHPTNDTLYFAWNKLSVSMPEGWTATICDNSMCYTSLVENGATLPVLPGDDGLMLIHCQPASPGTAVIRYTIFETATPWQVDTLTWIIEASPLSVADKAENKLPFTLIENRFLLNTNAYSTLTLTNTSGQQVLESRVKPFEEITLPQDQSAFYFLELSGDSGILRKKIWYQKN